MDELYLPIPRRRPGQESPPSKSTATATPSEDDAEEESSRPMVKRRSRNLFSFKLSKKDSADDTPDCPDSQREVKRAVASPGRVLSSLANLVYTRKQSLERPKSRIAHGRRHSALAGDARHYKNGHNASSFDGNSKRLGVPQVWRGSKIKEEPCGAETERVFPESVEEPSSLDSEQQHSVLSPIRERSDFQCRGYLLEPICVDRRPTEWPSDEDRRRILGQFERFLGSESGVSREIVHAFGHTLGLTLPEHPLEYRDRRFLLNGCSFEDLFVLGPVIGRGQQGEVRACMSRFVAWWIELKKGRCADKWTCGDEDLRYILLQMMRTGSSESDSPPETPRAASPPALIYAVKIVPKGLWNIHALTHFLDISRESENLVRTFAIYEDKWNYFTLMERLTGPSLLQYLTTIENPNEQHCRDLFAQVCRSLVWLHTFKLLHRDLKPSNFVFRSATPKWKLRCSASLPPNKYRDVLYQAWQLSTSSCPKENQDSSVVLIDVGLCCYVADADWLPPEGSTDYMAPELFLTRRAPFLCTTASDIWSAGQMLAFLLSGEPILPPGGICHSLRRVRPEHVFDASGKLIYPHLYWQIAVLDLCKPNGRTIIGLPSEPRSDSKSDRDPDDRSAEDDILSSLSSSFLRHRSSPIDHQFTLEQSSQLDAQLEVAEGFLYGGPRPMIPFPRTTSPPEDGRLSTVCPEQLLSIIDLTEASRLQLPPGWREYIHERPLLVYYLCGFEAAFERAVSRAGSIGVQALRLLLKMLTLDPALRPSAGEIIGRAPWLTSTDDITTSISEHARNLWKDEANHPMCKLEVELPRHLSSKWLDVVRSSNSSAMTSLHTEAAKPLLAEQRRSRRSSQLFATVANSIKGFWGNEEASSSARKQAKENSRRHSTGAQLESTTSTVVAELAEFLETRKRIIADINTAAMYPRDSHIKTLFVPSPVAGKMESSELDFFAPVQPTPRTARRASTALITHQGEASPVEGSPAEYWQNDYADPSFLDPFHEILLPSRRSQKVGCEQPAPSAEYLEESTQTEYHLSLDAGTQTNESYLEKLSKGCQTPTGHHQVDDPWPLETLRRHLGSHQASPHQFGSHSSSQTSWSPHGLTSLSLRVSNIQQGGFDTIHSGRAHTFDRASRGTHDSNSRHASVERPPSNAMASGIFVPAADPNSGSRPRRRSIFASLGVNPNQLSIDCRSISGRPPLIR